MYIIILGSGKVGAKVANLLSKKNHNIVVIDKEETSFSRLQEDFNGITILGNGIDEDVQREAGAEKADIFLSLTNDDNTNIMASQVAKHIFKIPRVITKVVETFHEYHFIKTEINPVSTNNIVAHEIINTFLPGETKRYSLLGENLRLVRSICNKKQTIKNYLSEHKSQKVVAIERVGETILPDNETEIKQDDIIYSVEINNGDVSL